MIEMRRSQLSFGEGLIAGEVSDLREKWMTHADEILGDEEIVAAVYEALAKRHPKSRSRGRPAAPAEMIFAISASDTMIPLGYRFWSNSQCTVNLVLVVVAAVS